MSRRPGNPTRRLSDGGSLPSGGSVQSKSRSSPLLSIGLVVVGAILLIVYCYSGSGRRISRKEGFSKLEGTGSCTVEVQRAIPILKKTYGNGMHKVLHVGPDTCSVVLKLLKQEETEAWGVEPYDLDDADANCKSFVRKGFVRAADIKFPLPYRPNSFSLVIISDALDYLTPRYLNKTLPELARVSSGGVVIFSGYPGQNKAKVAELSKFGRSQDAAQVKNLMTSMILDLQFAIQYQDLDFYIGIAFTHQSLFYTHKAKFRSSTWWIRYFLQNSLEVNEAASKKFEQALVKRSYKLLCQVFHLKS